LVDFFFRGEMTVRSGAEGVMGLIDGGNPASNCKDSCGFKRLKLRVTNSTTAINGVAQHFAGGSLTAVVKYSRNSCYTSNGLGDTGELTPFNLSCYFTGTDPVEEQVTANALAGPFNLNAGSETAVTLDFASPIPINAWNIRLQLIYRGTIGQEAESIAAHTQRLSAPTSFLYANDYDYLRIAGQLYTRAQVAANQTLLAQVEPSCVTGAVGSKSLLASCYQAQSISTSWTGANGAVLASLANLPVGRIAQWFVLGTFFETFNVTLPGALNVPTFFSGVDVRDGTLIDSTNEVYVNDLSRWRGLQSYQAYSRYYVASNDGLVVSATAQRDRPALANPAPVAMDSVNF
jgi:hypothetical protein